MGGAECERSEEIRGSGGLAPGKFLGATPFRRSENEGNALFSHILHHKHDYIEHKRQDVLLNFHQEIILIIASYSKKATEEFLFSYLDMVSEIWNILGSFHISITDSSFAKLMVHCRT